MKINIFNGPKKEFDKRIPKENYLTLTMLVRLIDSKDSSNERLLNQYNFFVIHSDEYAGVADFFIEGFLIHSLLFAEKLGYDEMYLHNPPAKILHQIEISKSNLDVAVSNHKYAKIEIEHLKSIKKDFDKVIHGQQNVKNELLASLYSLTNEGIKNPTVIMFYGPTSVGKTETAKFVNSIINSNEVLFRKQLSMFQSENFMNYIFGDKSNSFAKDLLDRETNIILLDEFDKAHPMFYSAFYQLFDEGVYTDKFYHVNLEDTVIFCTSNYLNENEIKKKLGDPIYSRFDYFIKFEELNRAAKEEIIDSVYEEELIKYNEEDQKLINEQNIKNKLKENSSNLNNAREIRKIMTQVMSYLLIEKL